MGKKDDIDDLLGEDTAKPAKKAAAKKAAAKKADAATTKDETKPVKKTAGKPADVKDAAEPKEPKTAPTKKAAVKDAAEPKEPKAKVKKEPINFEEGERQTITDGVTAHFKRSKKAINSRELAEKLGTETRKLRLVLYSLAKKEVIKLESGESKVAGMMVSPA